MSRSKIIGVCMATLGLLIALGFAVFAPEHSSTAAVVVEQPTSDPIKIAMADDPGLGSPPLRNSLTGSYAVINDWFRTHLNDYDSLEWVGSAEPRNRRYSGRETWAVDFSYRAKNGLGAKILKNATAYVRGGKCLVVVDD